jgi:hypothetical protein
MPTGLVFQHWFYKTFAIYIDKEAILIDVVIFNRDKEAILIDVVIFNRDKEAILIDVVIFFSWEDTIVF